MCDHFSNARKEHAVECPEETACCRHLGGSGRRDQDIGAILLPKKYACFPRDGAIVGERVAELLGSGADRFDWMMPISQVFLVSLERSACCDAILPDAGRCDAAQDGSKRIIKKWPLGNSPC